MKAELLPKQGDYCRVVVSNYDGIYLFTVRITDTVLAKWGITEAEGRLETATRLAEKIAVQSAVIDEQNEDYVFTSENVRDSLEETLNDFPF